MVGLCPFRSCRFFKCPSPTPFPFEIHFRPFCVSILFFFPRPRYGLDYTTWPVGLVTAPLVPVPFPNPRQDFRPGRCHDNNRPGPGVGTSFLKFLVCTRCCPVVTTVNLCRSTVTSQVHSFRTDCVLSQVHPRLPIFPPSFSERLYFPLEHPPQSRLFFTPLRAPLSPPTMWRFWDAHHHVLACQGG